MRNHGRGRATLATQCRIFLLRTRTDSETKAVRQFPIYTSPGARDLDPRRCVWCVQEHYTEDLKKSFLEGAAARVV